MTRNTRLHKVNYNETEIIYRDLTVTEIDFLENIKKEVVKFEFAAKLAIIEPTDTKDIPIGTIVQVGNNALSNSTKSARDKDLFEITVKEFRSSLENESASPLPLIAEVIKTVPGQSITDLLQLTYNDLIELVCLCEKIRNTQILSVGQGPKKKGIKLVDPKNLPDDGKSLKEKMAELNAALGTR